MQLVGVGAQRQEVVGRLDGRESRAADAHRARAGEDVDRRAHRRLELQHGGRRGVRRIDALAVDDHRQAEHAVALAQRAGQRAQVEPQGVRVEVAVTADVLEGVEVRVGGLRDLAQDEPAAVRAPREDAALAVGGRAIGDLHEERDPLAVKPGEDPLVHDRTEVVDVRDERMLVARVDERVKQARAQQRRVEVAVSGRRPFERRIGRPLHRREVVRAQLGHLALDEVGRIPSTLSRGWAPSAASEGSRVAKLFMRTSGSLAPVRARKSRVWRTTTSRNVSPSLT